MPVERGTTIRAAREDDAAGVAAIYGPYVTDTAVSFEEEAPSADEMARRIRAALLFLVTERNGRVVAYAYASPHRARHAYRFACDVSAYVAPGDTGEGLGSLLYRNLLPHLAALGLHTAHAGIALPNAASVALHERFGFAHVGTFREVGFKFGRWHDVGWWSRTL